MERYAKQIILREIGREGQRKLLNSKVAIVGCGALGSMMANNLARAGIGKIKVIDRDYVELDNLQRQFLYDEEDAKQSLPKAIACYNKLRKINSEIEIEPVIADVNPSNIESLIKGYDLVLDATDNMETRFLINDACHKNRIPWIYSAVIATEGMTLNILPGKACLRCFIQSMPSSLPTCETEGILNTTVAIVASIATTEAMKILLGKDVREEALYVDAWRNEFLTIKVKKRKNCPTCNGNYEFLNKKTGSQFIALCGRNAYQIMPMKKLSIEDVYEKVKKIAKILAYKDYMLRFSIENYEFIVFPDGRIIIKGVKDEKIAKSLYSRYIGN